MKSIAYTEQEQSTKDITIIDDSSICTEDNKGYIKLEQTSLKHIFPMIYFTSSILFLLIVSIFHVFEETNNDSKNLKNSLPSFYSLYKSESGVYIASILIIAITGCLDVWFLSSLLIQRFSVPELKSSKLTVNVMFFLGIFSNVVFIFLGFSSKILEVETEKIKYIRISLSMIIFLTFIFFNIFFAVLSLKVFIVFQNKIAINDKKLRKNVRTKSYIIYLILFIFILYLSSIIIDFYLHLNKSERKYLKAKFNFILKTLDILLLTLPYILFIMNALVNLSNSLDIKYLEDVINVVVDKEYFLQDETQLLLNV
jgi:hypothetical protein